MLQISNSYFSKTGLVGFQYKPVRLDVKKVCFDEKKDISNTGEKLRKCQSVTEWCRCGECGVMDTWVLELRWSWVFGYVWLLDMTYNDNAVTERLRDRTLSM